MFFGIKPSDNNELTHASDLAELGLAEELRMFFSGQEVVVLLGPIFRKPGGQQEHDVVIVDKVRKGGMNDLYAVVFLLTTKNLF